MPAFALLALLLFVGCNPGGGKCPAPPPAAVMPSAPVPGQPSTPVAPAGILDAMTGKATIDAGRRAAQQIRAVSSQERQDLDNALAP